MMVFRVPLKEILKAYFRLISSQMKSQSNIGNLTIKYKTGLTKNIWCIAHSMYCKV